MQTTTKPRAPHSQLYIDCKVPCPAEHAEHAADSMLWNVLRYLAESECSCLDHHDPSCYVAETGCHCENPREGNCVVCWATLLGYSLFDRFDEGDSNPLTTVEASREAMRLRYEQITGEPVPPMEI